MYKYNTMKKIWGYIFLALCLCGILSCKKEETKSDSRYDEIISRLDKIEKPEIASSQMQIESIRASLPEMADIPEAVENFSKSLDGVGDILRVVLDDVATEIASLESEFDTAREDASKAEVAMRGELVRQVNIVQSDVLSQLEEIRALVESDILVIRKAISLSDALALKIRSDLADTKSYAYSTASDSWETETLATLSFAKSLSVDFAAVSAIGEGLDDLLSESYSVISSDASEEISSAILPISYRITSGTAETIVRNYASAISDALEALREIWGKELPNRLPVVQNIIANWINPSLGAFEPLAKADSLLSYSAASLTNSLNSQKTYLESLKAVPDSLIATPSEALSHNEEGIETITSSANNLHSNLTEAMSALYAAYSQALSGAITENSGKIEGDFAVSVLKANTAALQAKDAASKSLSHLNSQVNSLRSEVGQVKKSITRSDVNILDNKIEAIASKLQSISFVPYYSDGSSPIYYTEYRGDFTTLLCEISYDIQPASVAEEISEVWDKALTLKGVYTSFTKVHAGDNLSFNITDFSQKNGRITITFKPEGISEDFLKEKIGASICLRISSGGISKGSSYSPITPYSIDWINFPDENFNRYLILNCDSNSDGHISAEEALEIKEIDMTEFTKFYPVRSLAGIEHFTNLEKLRCNSHLVGELDLSSNTNLVEVDCSNNNLEYIDLSECSKIVKLNIANNSLRSLDVSDLTSLEELVADNCKGVTELNLSNNTALTRFSMKYSGLTELDLRNNKSLTYFNLYDAPSHEFKVWVDSVDWLIDTYSSVGYGVSFYNSAGEYFTGGSIEIDGRLWMRFDSCGKKADQYYEQGDLYEWGGPSSYYCPTGWRLPESSEFETLIKNHSERTYRKGNYGTYIYGFWFSGSESYDESVPAVFLNQERSIAQGYYWCCDTDGDSSAFCLYLDRLSCIEIRTAPKTESHGVRCIKE